VKIGYNEQKSLIPRCSLYPSFTVVIVPVLRNTSTWLLNRGYVQEHHHVQLTESMLVSKNYNVSEDKPSVFSDFSRVGKSTRSNFNPVRISITFWHTNHVIG
jgi:hypothetical protein